MTRPLLFTLAALLVWSIAWGQSLPSKSVTEPSPLLLQPGPRSSSSPFTSKRKKAFHAVTSTFYAQEIRGGRSSRARTAQHRPPSQRRASFPAHFSASHTKPCPHKVIYGQETQLPIFIESEAATLSPSGPATRTSMIAISYAFLDQMQPTMHIQQPREEFVVRSISTDPQGEKHVRMQQQYQGVKVYGAEIVLHTKRQQLRQLSGRYQATPTLASTKPSFTEQQAVAVATADLNKETIVRPLKADEQKLLNYDRPIAELVIYQPDPAAVSSLVWHVTIRPNFVERWEYFVDAQNGTVVNYYNHTCHVDGPGVSTAQDLSGTPRQIQTYEVDGFDYLIDASRPMFDSEQSTLPDDPVGAIVTLDARNSPYTDIDLYYVRTQNDQWSPAAVSAHHNASRAYEYYRTTHNRNSINGQGGRILSIIDVADEDGGDFGNAAWNGAAMLYGNGNRAFSPLSRSLDVGGHEMTHGVIGSTANLEYQGESGAINESMADVFAVLIEREVDDWQLGEDVVNRQVYASGALRDMSDPHNGGTSLNDPGFQPKHVSEQYTGGEDNGGVHINSGIANHAFYLFATDENVGLEKAETVYYDVLTNYLTTASQFIDLRIAVVQATGATYGTDGPEAAAARAAFDAVGIGEGTGTEQRPDLPTATGDEFILSYNTDTTFTTTLYLTDTDGRNGKSLSTTPIKRKPSITDDGRTVLFVSEDGNIRTLSLEGDPDERIIQNDARWDNAAVSKDGTKMAAISTELDTSIYVYDFKTQQWAKFRLYNPSYTEGVTTGEVLYADALEWDYSGEYLMYDAFNQFSSPDGSDLEYWDVGFMRVWDNEANSFGDGTIEKLFSALPEGVSIGNPSFSKNSPTIVAFDYANLEDREYSLLTANITTNEVATVYNNTKIGYPNYSVSDDRLVFDALSQDDEEVIAVIDLQEDKLNPVDSNAFVLIKDAQWAIWFAQGDRNVLSDAKQLLTFSLRDFSPVVDGTIDGSSVVLTVPENTDLTQLVATFTHSTLATVQIGGTKQISGATANDFTQPLTYTVVAEDGSTQDYTVTVELDQTTQLSDAKEITAFSFNDLSPSASGIVSEDSVVLFVPEGTDVSALRATFELSPDAQVRVGLVRQESGVSINDFTNPVIYTVIAQDRSTRAYTVVAQPDRATGLADEATQRAVTLYPNPATSQITLAADGVAQRANEVVITDALGQVVQRQPLSAYGNWQQLLSIAGLPTGVYTARVVLEHSFVVKRFIKE